MTDRLIITKRIDRAAVLACRNALLLSLRHAQASTMRVPDPASAAWWDAVRIFDDQFGIELDEDQDDDDDPEESSE